MRRVSKYRMLQWGSWGAFVRVNRFFGYAFERITLVNCLYHYVAQSRKLQMNLHT